MMLTEFTTGLTELGFKFVMPDSMTVEYSSNPQSWLAVRMLMGQDAGGPMYAHAFGLCLQDDERPELFDSCVPFIESADCEYLLTTIKALLAIERRA